MSNNQEISNSTIYGIGIEYIKHTKDKRDEINRFFISLFSAALSFLPFLSNITEKVNIPYGYSINIVLIVFSVLGIALCISWIMMLRYTMLFLQTVENRMKEIERKCNIEFLIYISHFVEQTDSPDRVTKQEMYISYAFLGVFLVILLTSLAYAVLKV